MQTPKPFTVSRDGIALFTVHAYSAQHACAIVEDYAPTVPDWALDQHTIAGRKLGRGLDHFREHGAKLIPEPTEPDAYEDEAYRLWALKQQGK